MDRVLEKHNLPKLNQEETENINRSVTNMEIKSVIKHLSANRSLGPDVLTGKFYQTFREEIMPIFLKLFQKFADWGTFTDFFYKATITLITKPGKDNTH